MFFVPCFSSYRRIREGESKGQSYFSEESDHLAERREKNLGIKLLVLRRERNITRRIKLHKQISQSSRWLANDSHVRK